MASFLFSFFRWSSTKSPKEEEEIDESDIVFVEPLVPHNSPVSDSVYQQTRTKLKNMKLQHEEDVLKLKILRDKLAKRNSMHNDEIYLSFQGPTEEEIAQTEKEEEEEYNRQREEEEREEEEVREEEERGWREEQLLEEMRMRMLEEEEEKWDRDEQIRREEEEFEEDVRRANQMGNGYVNVEDDSRFIEDELSNPYY